MEESPAPYSHLYESKPLDACSKHEMEITNDLRGRGEKGGDDLCPTKTDIPVPVMSIKFLLVRLHSWSAGDWDNLETKIMAGRRQLACRRS